jgi:2-amino-4-hydroxy-6-hydroxymethyldihydropteridine diphosphokinase
VTVAYVGLGSNLGDRGANLRRALAALAPHAVAVSPVYESDPVGPVTDQPPFWNAVAELSWPGDPVSLLRHLLTVERRLGRVRTVPKGPRTIDLDLLLFGGVALRTVELEVPHPALLERPFAVVPLLDLAPDLRLPDGRRLAEAGHADRTGLRPVPLRLEVGP